MASSFGSDALAYEFFKTEDGARSLRWWAGRPAYTWSLATVEPEEGAWADIQGLVETAFDSWIDAPCGLAPEFTFAGTSTATGWTRPTSLGAPPDNVIVFIRSRTEWQRAGNASSWLAITKIANDRVTGEIIDADILINDGMYTYHYGEGAPPLGQIDFRAMIVHEVGHVYGLDHSLAPGSTMNAAYSSGDPVTARSLDQDDIDGICALYTDVPEWVDPDVKPPQSDSGCGSGAGTGLWAGLLGVLAFGVRRRGARA